MDRHTPSTATAFNKLPLELNKLIAHCLSADRDIANYRSICRATNFAIDGDQRSFWRAKFRETFALLDGKSNKILKYQYQRRSRYLRVGKARKFEFTFGHSLLEKKILGVLKDLIVESFKGDTIGHDSHDRPQCLNQIVLYKFVEESHLLLNNKRPQKHSSKEISSTNPTLLAVKLVCSQFLFDTKAAWGRYVIAMEETQEAVYSTMKQNPIFLDPELNTINMDYIYHCCKFFQHYMFNREASQLTDTMEDLEPLQRPSPWNGPLKSGSYPLGNRWKGTYAYLEHGMLNKVRERMHKSAASKTVTGYEYWIEDLNVDEGNIQSFHLDFVPEKDMKWPNVFEKKLKSKRQTVSIPSAQQSKKTAADSEAPGTANVGVIGWGEDRGDDFLVSGWLNPLPSQAEIPGWQRVTLMKHFEEDEGDSIADNLWAYEGVVLPGGKMILGRWWYASDDEGSDSDYSGPFIMWAVEPDAPALDPNSDDETGLKSN